MDTEINNTIEKNYTKYYSCSTITDIDILQRLIDGEDVYDNDESRLLRDKPESLNNKEWFMLYKMILEGDIAKETLSEIREQERRRRVEHKAVYAFNGVTFDDVTVGDEGTRSQICDKCLTKHEEQLEEATISEYIGSGICGVEGCAQEDSEHYIDFPTETK